MQSIPIKVLYTCTKTFETCTPDTWILGDDLDILYAVDSQNCEIDSAHVTYYHMDANNYIPLSSDLRLRKLGKAAYFMGKDLGIWRLNEIR